MSTGLNQIVTCACCGKQLPKSNRCKICGGYTPARFRIVRDLTAAELSKIARRKALLNELVG